MTIPYTMTASILFPKIPVSVLSANAQEEDVQACLDAGMNAHPAKPFQPEQLRGLPEEYL